MKVTIRTDGFEGWATRSRERAEKLTRQEKIVPERTINFDSAEHMLECLSAERVRLCEVARTDVFTVTSLAAALGRDPRSVRRDIQKLEQYGIIRTREQVNPGHGRVKIVEPVARKIELRTSI